MQDKEDAFAPCKGRYLLTCCIGTCQVEGDGYLVRHKERILRPAESQAPHEMAGIIYESVNLMCQMRKTE